MRSGRGRPPSARTLVGPPTLELSQGRPSGILVVPLRSGLLLIITRWSVRIYILRGVLKLTILSIAHKIEKMAFSIPFGGPGKAKTELGDRLHVQLGPAQ